MTGTSGERRRMVGKGLAVGVGLLVGALAGPGQGWAQMPAPSAGAPRASAGVQPAPQTVNPGFRGYGATTDPGRTVEQRHRLYDRDRDRDRDRDWHRGWDRDRSHRPYWGHYGNYPYYPRYGYAYPGPYGTYPGRWVWDGWNWVFVPLY